MMTTAQPQGMPHLQRTPRMSDSLCALFDSGNSQALSHFPMFFFPHLLFSLFCLSLLTKKKKKKKNPPPPLPPPHYTPPTLPSPPPLLPTPPSTHPPYPTPTPPSPPPH